MPQTMLCISVFKGNFSVKYFWSAASVQDGVIFERGPKLSSFSTLNSMFSCSIVLFFVVFVFIHCNVKLNSGKVGIPDDLKKPGWELVKDKETNLLKCRGRIQGYNPVYLEDTQFTRKLIQHVHTQIQHLGVANTMATLREEWWIPRLRTLVKKEVRDCNVCKVFAAKPYGAPTTSALPEFRTNVSRPFQYVGVDFAGPLKCKEGKTKEEKAYVLIFTCATSRAVHLELTRSQTAEEFQRKLNAFITRRTRPEKIVSDNAATFKATATWIRRIRKSEKLQNCLAQQEITWQFNLSKSPWWGGMYERLIKEVKKTAYKTLGNTHLTFQQLEVVIMDIEKHLNNRPLTYVESEEGEPQTLTPNTLM